LPLIIPSCSTKISAAVLTYCDPQSPGDMMARI
jgi:hypothetical protein